MASGSEARQRPIMLAARFNDQEAEAIRRMADRAGVPVASFIRAATLNAPASRATRRPTANHQAVARLVGEIGRLAEALRALQATGAVAADDPRLVAAWRDIADLRAVCFEAMGRQP